MLSILLNLVWIKAHWDKNILHVFAGIQFVISPTSFKLWVLEVGRWKADLSQYRFTGSHLLYRIVKEFEWQSDTASPIQESVNRYCDRSDLKRPTSKTRSVDVLTDKTKYATFENYSYSPQ